MNLSRGGITVLAVLLVISLGVAANGVTPGGGVGSGASDGQTDARDAEDRTKIPPSERTPDPGQEEDQGGGGARDSSGGTGGSAGSAGVVDGVVTTLSSPAVLLAGVGVLAALAVAVAVRSGGATAPERDGDGAEENDEDDHDERLLGDVGNTAGRAADRMAETGAEPENAVYDAWLEMTRHLSVPDPSTSTPREFADAAVAAGMNPNDVEDLTGLFELVRYGDAQINDRREDRAQRILRRIEATYADAVGDDSEDTQADVDTDAPDTDGTVEGDRG